MALARSTLWRHPDFLKLWAGQAVSLFGSQITPVALPLAAALTLDAAPSEMGLLRAAEYAPAVLVGLFAGVWVDRLRRRRVLIWTNVARAVVLLAVPAATALGLLRVELLYVVAFLSGVLGVFFGAAYAAFLPGLVPRERLVEANSRLATTNAVAQIAGPGLAGALIDLVRAPLAIAVDGLTFLVSAAAIGLIRGPEAAPTRREPRRHIWAEIGEGLHVLASDPILRAFTASSATLDLFWNGLMAVYFLYLTRDLGLPATAFGLIFGVGSAGALAGSVLAVPAARRFGLGPAIVGAQLLLGVGGLLIALAVWLPAAALPLLVATELIQSGANTIYGVNRDGLVQTITPDRLRGRVHASSAFAGMAAVTAGSLLGGVLGERIGLSATVVTGACGGLVAFIWLWYSPIRRLRHLPNAPR